MSVFSNPAFNMNVLSVNFSQPEIAVLKDALLSDFTNDPERKSIARKIEDKLHKLYILLKLANGKTLGTDGYRVEVECECRGITYKCMVGNSEREIIDSVMKEDIFLTTHPTKFRIKSISNIKNFYGMAEYGED